MMQQTSPSLVERFLGAGAALLGGGLTVPPIPPVLGTGHDDWPRLYSLCWDYYVGVGLYDDLGRLKYGLQQWAPALKNLRNPAFDVVEFYVSHVWPGPLETALPLEAKTPSHKDAIRQIWDWSNWSQRKNVFVRRCAIFGDGFIHVTQPLGKAQVYHQLIDPRMVTEFDTDHRGFVTYIRLTQQLPIGRNGQTLIRTEVWDKAAGTRRVWQSPGEQQDVLRLGTPLEETPLSDYGIDFIPFVWVPFRDIGERRGLNSFFAQKDEIDELNAMATRLHQLLFRFGKPTMAVMAGGLDSEGRPMPAPSFGNRDGTTGSANTVTMGDDDILEFPGASRMEYLVPNIPWASHIAEIEAQQADLEVKLPEIKYARLATGANMSGAAIRQLLAPAIKRCEEVRGNLEAGLQQADAMALSIAAAQGLQGFGDLGSFDAGDFAHTFKPREIMPLSEEEQAATALVEAQTALLWSQLGISQASIQQRLGFDPVRETALREATSAQLADALLTSFEKGQ